MTVVLAFLPETLARPPISPPSLPLPTSPRPPAGLAAELLALIAERTGYPAEVLTPDMELDTDLGLDSIKRVELLAALRTRVPNPPAVSVLDLHGPRTLGEITALLTRPHIPSPQDNHTRTFRAELRLADFPVLRDHVVNCAPTLPLSLAIEWFTAATEHPVLLDVTALRRTTSPTITLRGRGRAVELTADVPHVRATLGEPSDRRRDWTTGARSPVRQELYDGFPLFHGPLLQSITELHAVTGELAEATVVGARRLGWEGEHWRTDPAAVDGCLQLALLWGRQVFGGNSLPAGVREFRLHRPGPLGGPSRCVLVAGPVHGGRAECDVALVDADRVVRAELFGVSITRHPR